GGGGAVGGGRGGGRVGGGGARPRGRGAGQREERAADVLPRRPDEGSLPRLEHSVAVGKAAVGGSVHGERLRLRPGGGSRGRRRSRRGSGGRRQGYRALDDLAGRAAARRRGRAGRGPGGHGV